VDFWNSVLTALRRGWLSPFSLKLPSWANWLPAAERKSKSRYEWRSVSEYAWCRAHCGTCRKILILSETCCLVSVGSPLSREVGYVRSFITDRIEDTPKSKPKTRYNWLSVFQYVKVSSPLCNLWPDTTFCPKVFVWKLLSCLCGALSLTRGRVCHMSFSVCSNLSVFT
jgi:hypothetical protein